MKPPENFDTTEDLVASLTDQDFHPDNPAPIGYLIYALHLRTVALEEKAGLREKPKEDKKPKKDLKEDV